ncbi:uncharacterized protein LOC126672341 [Mercurialis annua]|uniref:uncharacterized protein LOC126672341 n=1 Tax=Mercurialis annua TaxID=3986 RepID=UPI00215FF59B|nr:uncharacterized protein LOC126672341 [Mercurialis annua]
MNWNLFGDRNTKIFHSIASVHSRNNLITKTMINNVSYKSLFDIKEHIFLFYKDLYKKNQQITYSLEALDLCRLSDSQAASLSAGFSKEEICLTVLGNDNNKTPGINTAFLVLIPKVIGEDNISDFRPISMINGIFKLISKRFNLSSQIGFQKTFDSISRDFILKMLSRLNFYDTWIKWMSSFFNSSQLSVLVNSSPTN